MPFKFNNYTWCHYKTLFLHKINGLNPSLLIYEAHKVTYITYNKYNLLPTKKATYLIWEAGSFHQIKHKESLMCSMKSRNKEKCICEYLFSMSQYITNKLASIHLTAKIKSQMNRWTWITLVLLLVEVAHKPSLIVFPHHIKAYCLSL
jgi:hypothetical protein